MTFSMKTLLTCTTSAFCMVIGAANAQSVDYTTLQQTFGEPVTMSATGKPQRASDVPADMIIITQDQIRRSGATKLMDVLKFVPGLDVRTYGDNNAEVNVHGYLQPKTPRLLVLINGRQVYLDHYGYVDWNTLPVQLSEIQQIEIVKGPGSSLFGFNAYSGVINIITIDPLKTKKAEVQATVGTYGMQNYSAVVAEKLTDTVAVKASGGYSTQQGYHISPMLGTPVDPEAYNATAEVNWQALDNVVVTGEGTYARSRQYELAPTAGFANMDYLTTSYKAGVVADTSFGLVSVTGYTNHLHHIAHDPYMGDLSLKNDVNVVSANDLLKVGSDVTVRIAGEYRYNKFKSAYGSVNEQLYSTSAMVDWAITPELSFTNSARLDWMSPEIVVYGVPAPNETNFAYSFNSGLVYKAGTDDTIRLLGGRSIQAPSLILYATFAGSIKPSSLTNVELSWDHSFRSISSDLHVAVYRQWLNKVIEFSAINMGNSAQTGVEASFSGASESGWRWNTSVNYRSVHDNLIPIPTNVFFLAYGLDFKATMPKYELTFGGGKTWGDFEFDLQGKWTSSSKDWAPYSLATTYVTVPDYLTATARIGYRLTDNFTIAVTAAQFNQKTVYEGAVYPDKRRFMVTLTSSL